ncbi:MAG: HAD hydrolase-like protein [Chloroflexota bacterium]|nr:HAD hydrolase-like protein [Chloroflexota bacterium]
MVISHRARTATSETSGPSDDLADAVVLDLDTVLLAMHRGRRGIELGLQPDLPEAFERLHEVARNLIVIVDPPPRDSLEAAGRQTATRLQALRDGLGPLADELIIVACPHGENGNCQCGKPSAGLVEYALTEHRLAARGSWYISGDQEGVQAGRAAGLKTIRIGPVGEDHLSNVHRPDHEARDLLDAANQIMLDALALP